ncbi:malonate--CoA ligase ACSF3, mitochondrial [Plutella xylostella]|uniref:malonate--CoA ligase ACSF3, mitochondrial n=1 Tax=Plutella xylostella TaxID=51655 RepID=UPI002032CEFA|nr:malonate--CoA ligase ACSF3, mitochondrial [Plutella xylostella]
MVFAVRPVFSWARCLRPTVTFSYRHVAGTAVKELRNSELVSSYNKDIKAGGVVPVFRRALLFPNRIALQDEVGVYTYAALHHAATSLSKEIAAQLCGDTGRTIAYMCGNDAAHVTVQWAIWMSGNIAVPLTPLHPADMLKYFLEDSDSKLVICTQEFEKLLRPVAIDASKPLLISTRDKEVSAQVCQSNETKEASSLEDLGRSNMWYGGQDALIIYTSGTTSKPKGVIFTHTMLQTQIAALHTAWGYSAEDVVLHTLPLHHIHGQLNSLNASLASGARINMLPRFAPHTVWARLLAMNDDVKPTVFHGVPAMYAALVAAHTKMFGDGKTTDYVRGTLEGRVRLMCAGSAPLPSTLAETWFEITGIRLLERYGMSEAGMALSNPYTPVEGRTVSSVGHPLPGIAARLATEVDGEMKPLLTVETPMCETQICLQRLGASNDPPLESDNFEWKPPVITEHTASTDGTHQGELLLKGPGIFSRYLNRPPSLNSKDFTPDGWFRTGDTAAFEDNKFKIMGRTSMDIIKTGGYKVSALQVESAILEHPSVADAAALGIEDPAYGEIVSAVVQLKPNETLTLGELKRHTGKKLAPYQLPKTMLVVEQMPRNVMGKLDKKVIRQKYADKLGLKKGR